jgi:hypothetical protein
MNGQGSTKTLETRMQTPIQPLERLPGGQAPLGSVEIQGVSAGAFNPALWENDQLHWVPDVRMLATAWPDANKMNKPICFLSSDGKIGNGSPEPYRAAHQPNATPQPKNTVGTCTKPAKKYLAK